MNSAAASPIESVLRDELARADRALSGIAPVLGHVLVGSGHSLVNDAVVARVRGMLNDVSRQLVARLSEPVGGEEAFSAPLAAKVAEQLAQDTPMLSYLHALAMEGLLTEKLDRRAAIDPVLSPLFQELIASQDALTGELAMQALTAQARFTQAQRRMQLPLLDLSPAALERALRIWVRATPVESEASATGQMRELKGEYDEAQSRTGLIARLVSSMRGGVVAALELEHAGFALFVSAFAQQSGQSRERAILACHEQQSTRLAVGLRAANLKTSAIERQFLSLDIPIELPRDLEALAPDVAAAMLQDGSFGSAARKEAQ